jgi:hypothetical protein
MRSSDITVYPMLWQHRNAAVRILYLTCLCLSLRLFVCLFVCSFVLSCVSMSVGTESQPLPEDLKGVNLELALQECLERQDTIGVHTAEKRAKKVRLRS